MDEVGDAYRGVIWGYPAKVSGLAPRQGPLKLAGCPQLLAASSGRRAR